MLNKGAIELSLNFIVILIISIIIFGFGVKFISDLSSSATEIQELTVSELDEKISSLICEGSDRVCIGIDRKTIKRTKFDVFGIKIINVIDEENFRVRVYHPLEYLGFTRDKQEILRTGNLKGLLINPPERDVAIKKNEEKNIGVGVEVPVNAVSGTYILNVEIKTRSGELYSTIQKLYVDVP